MEEYEEKEGGINTKRISGYDIKLDPQTYHGLQIYWKQPCRMGSFSEGAS